MGGEGLTSNPPTLIQVSDVGQVEDVGILCLLASGFAQEHMTN